MSKALQADLHLTRSPEQHDALFLALMLTAGQVQRANDDLLKRHGLQAQQYNVLRILRGAGPRGLPCGEIAMRMIAHDPDITRLVGRLEQRGLVDRMRDAEDRRVIRVRITSAGRELIDPMDEPLSALHREQFAHLSDHARGQLLRLLDRVRHPDD